MYTVLHTENGEWDSPESGRGEGGSLEVGELPTLGTVKGRERYTNSFNS